MSALYGILNLNGAPCDPKLLLRMNGALAMYGRAQQGQYCVGEIGLGQHLSRITPQDAFETQPVYSADKQIVIVGDARLDNRVGLARALDLRDWQSLPDSALILRAYEKWKTDCARQLIGDFAFAVWDARLPQLFVARSPFSTRALFIHATPQTFAFASMPKGLHALPHIPRQLDEGYLADYLAWVPSAPTRTFYRGITRLLPGQSIIIRDGKIQTQSFWELDLKREIRFKHDDEYVDAFHALFERVVADALVTCSHVGIMLSGGLDSSSIAAVAAPLLARDGKKLAAFTQVPSAHAPHALGAGRYADETPFVQALARRYANLDVHLVQTGGGFYLDNIAAFFEATELPFRNASNRLWYEEILRRAQAKQVGVMLNGAQGNLTFSWRGDGLIAQLVQAGQWSRAWREASALARRGESHSTWRALAIGTLPLLPDAIYDAVMRLSRQRQAAMSWGDYSPIHPEFYRAQRVEERARGALRDRTMRPRGDLRELRAQTLLGTSTAGDGFGAGYQAMFEIEQRAPAADQRIVELCFALPEDQFVRDGTRRWLIQRAMSRERGSIPAENGQNRLPPEILHNKQRGLQAADWYEQLYNARAQVLGELARLETIELAARAVDLKRLRGLVEQMPERVTDAGRAVSDYRGILEIGLMTARFVAWVETGE